MTPTVSTTPPTEGELREIEARHEESSAGPFAGRWTEDRILREQARAHNDRGALLRALKARLTPTAPVLTEDWKTRAEKAEAELTEAERRARAWQLNAETYLRENSRLTASAAPVLQGDAAHHVNEPGRSVPEHGGIGVGPRSLPPVGTTASAATPAPPTRTVTREEIAQVLFNSTFGGTCDPTLTEMAEAIAYSQADAVLALIAASQQSAHNEIARMINEVNARDLTIQQLTAASQSAPAPDPIEVKARKLYVDYTDNAGIHSNRFPSWGELSEVARAEWRTKASPENPIEPRCAKCGGLHSGPRCLPPGPTNPPKRVYG